MSDDRRPFPIQRETYLPQPRSSEKGKACTVPWWLAEVAYESYSKSFGAAQSLERIAERGGFGRAELVSLIRREWERKSQTEKTESQEVKE